MTPAISVIITAYNVAKFIETCVDSLRLQTFRNFEAVIIDDCSSDKTFELVRDKYTNFNGEKYDPRIRIYKNIRNVGYAGLNVNKAMSLIDPLSKYVYIIDSDDILTEDCLESLYEGAEKSRADIVIMNEYYYTFDQGFSMPDIRDLIKFPQKLPAPFTVPNDIVDRLQGGLINGWIPGVNWLKLYRHDFFVNSGLYFPQILGIEDFFSNIAGICLAEKIFITPACCYIYRQRPDSVMRFSADKQLINIMGNFVNVIPYLEEFLTRTTLSEENRLIVKSYAVATLIQERILRYGLSLEEINDILLKVTTERSAIAPEVSHYLIQALTYILSFHFYKKADRKELFQLVR